MLGDKKGLMDFGRPPQERFSSTRLLRAVVFCFVIAVVVGTGRQTAVFDAILGVCDPWVQKQEAENRYISNRTTEGRLATNLTLFDGKCNAVVVLPGAFDGHWWSGSLPGLKSRFITQPLQYPFEYNRQRDEFRVAYQFMQSLYGDKNRVRTDIMFQGLKNLQLGQIGDTATRNDASRPSDAPFVARATLPRWYPAELGYRVTAAWRAILTIAMDQNTDDPVKRYFDTQVPTTGVGPAAIAQYPNPVRDLITKNSAKVHSGGTLGKTWIGRNVSVTASDTPPFAGVEVGYDTRVTTWQRGAAGPFSVEAAFILATQVAGLNFRAVARAIQQSDQIEAWWSGVLMPGNRVQALQCLNEQAFASGERLYGKYQLSGSGMQHDPRAGMYIAFDLDPTLTNSDADRHNVFIFVIHALDGYSVFQVARDSTLRDVQIRSYTPSKGAGDALFWGPGGSSNDPPPLPPRDPNRANTRQVAHAHAAILKKSTFLEWLRSTDNQKSLPAYTQISMQHLYILTEDWDMGTGDKPQDWPRRQWLSTVT